MVKLNLLGHPVEFGVAKSNVLMDAGQPKSSPDVPMAKAVLTHGILGGETQPFRAILRDLGQPKPNADVLMAEAVVQS